MIKASEYSERREKLINMMEPQSAMVLFSGVEKCKSADEDYPFEVARNFYYLTGIDQPDSMLLLINVDGERKEFLFVSPFDERKEKWYGRRLTLEEAEARSGVHNVLVNFSFQGKLDATLSPSISQFGDITSLYVDLDRELKIADDTYIDDFLSTIKKAYQNVNILNAYPLVTQLRLRKSVGEIQELRSAIKSTHLGINAALKILAPGRKEYELADAFRHAINDSNGYQGESFNTIMASGIHTTCLHYPKPVDTVPEGGLVLIRDPPERVQVKAVPDPYRAAAEGIPFPGKFPGGVIRLRDDRVCGLYPDFAADGYCLIPRQQLAGLYQAGCRTPQDFPFRQSFRFHFLLLIYPRRPGTGAPPCRCSPVPAGGHTCLWGLPGIFPRRPHRTGR